jgi:hypothetical protein
MRQLLTQITSSSPVRRWAPVVVVCLPIAFAAVRAAAGDWVPAGDDAYFTVRSRDVLTSNHPLLGAWSSGSVDLETPINNLGAIQADLLAPFTRFTPMGGTAIGVAVVNIAAIVAIAWMVRRIGGDRAVLPAMCAVALLTWTMGSEMLITPRQHQFLILAYLCLLVATWAVATGDRWAIVIAVVTASLVAQTHLSYPVLVAVLAGVMIVGQIVTTREGAADGGRRPFVVGGVVLAVLWIQPLIDQFFGEGNLGHVLFGSGDAGRTGLTGGARIVAAALVSVHMFTRPGYREFDVEMRFAPWWQSLVFWAAVAAGTMYAVRTIRLRGWIPAAGVVVALAAVIAGVLDAAMLPRTSFGYAVMNYRWLWATGTFVLMLVLIAVERRLAGTQAGTDRPLRPATAIALFTVCVVAAIANLPRSVQTDGAERYLSEQRNVISALDQLGPVLGEVADAGPVLIDDSAMYFGHPYTYPTLVAMQEHGIDFRFAEPVQERRFGSGRVSDGSERQVLRMVSGDAALALEGDPSVVAFMGGDRPVAFVIEAR